MAYPWYSTNRRVAGKNGKAAATVIENCETNEKRLKLDVLIGRKLRSATVELSGLLAAGEKILQKANCTDELIVADLEFLARSESLATYSR